MPPYTLLPACISAASTCTGTSLTAAASLVEPGAGHQSCTILRLVADLQQSNEIFYCYYGNSVSVVHASCFTANQMHERTSSDPQVKYPENFFLLRGNHECASINRIYGFYDECKRRYNIRLWKTFTDCFNCLPVAALVDEKVGSQSYSSAQLIVFCRLLAHDLTFACSCSAKKHVTLYVLHINHGEANHEVCAVSFLPCLRPASPTVVAKQLELHFPTFCSVKACCLLQSNKVHLSSSCPSIAHPVLYLTASYCADPVHAWGFVARVEVSGADKAHP